MKHRTLLHIAVLWCAIGCANAQRDLIYQGYFTNDTVNVTFSPSGEHYVLAGDKIRHGVFVWNSDGTVYNRIVLPADTGKYASGVQRGFFNDSLLIVYEFGG
jgi:hypothetical protein